MYEYLCSPVSPPLRSLCTNGTLSGPVSVGQKSWSGVRAPSEPKYAFECDRPETRGDQRRTHLFQLSFHFRQLRKFEICDVDLLRSGGRGGARGGHRCGCGV